MAAPDQPLLAALAQQRLQPIERRPARRVSAAASAPETHRASRRKAASFWAMKSPSASSQGSASTTGAPRMRRRDRARERIRERGVDFPLSPAGRASRSRRSAASRPPIRPARPPVERQASVRLARDRHDAPIELWREGPVDLEFGLACGLALLRAWRNRETEIHRALDLVDALAGEEHRGRMRVDAPDARTAMRRGGAQQREYLRPAIRSDACGRCVPSTPVTWQQRCAISIFGRPCRMPTRQSRVRRA